MGIGIDVMNGTMVRGNKEKTFIICAAPITGKATSPYDRDDSRFWADCPYSNRMNALSYLTKYLNERHGEVVSGNHENTDEKAFGEDGRLRMEIHITVVDEVSKHFFVEIAKDGFYLYESAKDMDEKRGRTYHTSDAEETVRVYSGTAEAATDRFETRKHFVDDACREERLTRDRLKRKVKSASNKKKGELKKQLKEAQKALDDKKASVRESEGYKALLVPGEMESVWAHK